MIRLRIIPLAIHFGIRQGVYAEPDLPTGVWNSGPGVYKARCRSCDRTYELCYDPKDFTHEANVCGGSDRCVL